MLSYNKPLHFSVRKHNSPRGHGASSVNGCTVRNAGDESVLHLASTRSIDQRQLCTIHAHTFVPCLKLAGIGVR